MLVVSSDLPEVLSLADRIVVMNEGELQGELAGADATEEDGDASGHARACHELAMARRMKRLRADPRAAAPSRS